MSQLQNVLDLGTRQHLLDQAFEQSGFRETLARSCCREALFRLVADPSRQVRATGHGATFEARKWRAANTLTRGFS
jgi:hypothetical protein